MGKKRKRGMGIDTGKSNITAPCPKMIDRYFQNILKYNRYNLSDNPFYALYTKDLNHQDNAILPELAGITCNSQIIVDLYTGAIVDDYLKVNKKKINTFAECENESIKTIFKWHANIVRITCEYIKYGWLERYTIKKELEEAKSKGKILNKTNTRNLLIKTMPIELSLYTPVKEDKRKIEIKVLSMDTESEYKTMLSKKIKNYFDNHAKELTEKYLKDQPDLKFVPIYSIDEVSDIPTITMKLVKKEENTDEKDTE